MGGGWKTTKEGDIVWLFERENHPGFANFLPFIPCNYCICNLVWDRVDHVIVTISVRVQHVQRTLTMARTTHHPPISSIASREEEEESSDEEIDDTAVRNRIFETDAGPICFMLHKSLRSDRRSHLEAQITVCDPSLPWILFTLTPAISNMAAWS
jgi:hypothetical protein